MTASSTPMHEYIAHKLNDLIVTSSLRELPSVQELRARFNAGERIIRKAIRLLQQQGVVQTCQGRKTIVLRHEGYPEQPRLGDSGQALLHRLKDHILTGRLRVGHHVPKVDFLAASAHVSRTVVVKVLRTMRDEGLVHKDGRYWIAGIKPPQRKEDVLQVLAVRQHAPVVLIMTDTYQEWLRINTTTHLKNFLLTFQEECDKWGIRTMVVGIDEALSSRFFISGLRDVGNLIQSLGDRYLGTLFYQEHLEIKGHERNEWISLFARGRKPFVWLQIVDREDTVSLGSLPPDLNLYRVCSGHPSVVAMALRALVERGHKNIAVPFFRSVPGMEWSKARMELFRSSAHDYGESLQLHTPELDRECWDASAVTPQNWEDPEETVLRAVQCAGGNSSTGKDEMLRNASPVLCDILRQGRVTAIVAPNDRVAAQFYVWLDGVGVHLPKDMSMISFNNSAAARQFPIATVDFGAGHMGYCAAHLFIGDIHIQTDSRRSVGSKCFLVDRGSLASPRRGGARLGWKI